MRGVEYWSLAAGAVPVFDHLGPRMMYSSVTTVAERVLTVRRAPV
jgi:hypothetical protein